jgi:sphingosine kinase
VYGNRYEKHRRYLLKPAEDLADARSLVSFIRKIAKLEQRDKNIRYLIMVNPFSGTKKGVETYHNVVKKMLNERGVDHDVLVTTKAGHAVERVKEDFELNDGERDLREYDGIVVLGGDGILSEILQGLRTRNDYDDIMKRLKFGIVGCGACNLATALFII